MTLSSLASLQARLRAESGLEVDREEIDAEESADALIQLLREPLRAALAARRHDPAAQARICEEVLECLSEGTDLAPDLAGEPRQGIQRLLGIASAGLPGQRVIPDRPSIPLAQSALLVNARDQPRIGTEVGREIASAEVVKLLCAFLKWEGFRVLEASIEEHCRRGRELRVLTTTYIGATDRRVLDRLAELGAQVRVCYETGRTRLHAKAWLFERQTGFHTAYIGSSNLSRAALLDGLEWNVRVTAIQQPHLIDTFRATFDDYWNDARFEPYDPARDADRFDRAIAKERGWGSGGVPTLSGLEVTPWPHQRRMLEQLSAEREVHGRFRNLVVSATGTGKTILAALDYERLRRAGKVDSLLFVAHRREIIDQSLRAFREVLRRGDFGEELLEGRKPRDWRHVFASVQSLHRLAQEKVAPDLFDMVIIDEFHHAEAPTYSRWLEHLAPTVLLGLTATPERSDGVSVTRWFDGRAAVELRLWEALEEGLLSPFQYFGIHDGTDLSNVRWTRGGYDLGILAGVLTGNDARAGIILQEVHNKVADVRRMRALGFCVSVEHARYMARYFASYGVPALAVSGDTPSDERGPGAPPALGERDQRALLGGSLQRRSRSSRGRYGLFLRPTESSTLFLQQLGRGLRLAPDKSWLTVLDFIGRQHAKFRFDAKYRVLLPAGRGGIEREVEAGFPFLPAGCHIELDRVASDLVLANLREAIEARWTTLVRELRQVGDVPLERFLAETSVDIGELYRSGRLGWAALRRDAGIDRQQPGDLDRSFATGISRLLHVDDPERVERYASFVRGNLPQSNAGERETRLFRMLSFLLWRDLIDAEGATERFTRLSADQQRGSELLEVLGHLRARITRVTRDLGHRRIPLRLHASYRRDEIVAAFGGTKPSGLREGVRWVEEEKADFFLVTLRKTERHFSPTTRYQDRAISEDLFQWESQSQTTLASPTGQRYLQHVARGSSVHLFVRTDKKGATGEASPFLYLGPARYVSHEGERPIRIIWRLDTPMPEEIFELYRLAAA